MLSRKENTIEEILKDPELVYREMLRCILELQKNFDGKTFYNQFADNFMKFLQAVNENDNSNLTTRKKILRDRLEAYKIITKNTSPIEPRILAYIEADIKDDAKKLREELEKNGKKYHDFLSDLELIKAGQINATVPLVPALKTGGSYVNDPTNYKLPKVLEEKIDNTHEQGLLDSDQFQFILNSVVSFNDAGDLFFQNGNYEQSTEKYLKAINILKTMHVNYHFADAYKSLLELSQKNAIFSIRKHINTLVNEATPEEICRNVLLELEILNETQNPLNQDITIRNEIVLCHRELGFLYSILEDKDIQKSIMHLQLALQALDHFDMKSTQEEYFIAITKALAITYLDEGVHLAEAEKNEAAIANFKNVYSVLANFQDPVAVDRLLIEIPTDIYFSTIYFKFAQQPDTSTDLIESNYNQAINLLQSALTKQNLIQSIPNQTNALEQLLRIKVALMNVYVKRAEFLLKSKKYIESIKDFRSAIALGEELEFDDLTNLNFALLNAEQLFFSSILNSDLNLKESNASANESNANDDLILEMPPCDEEEQQQFVNADEKKRKRELEIGSNSNINETNNDLILETPPCDDEEEPVNAGWNKRKREFEIGSNKRQKNDVQAQQMIDAILSNPVKVLQILEQMSAQKSQDFVKFYQLHTSYNLLEKKFNQHEEMTDNEKACFSLPYLFNQIDQVDKNKLMKIITREILPPVIHKNLKLILYAIQYGPHALTANSKIRQLYQTKISDVMQAAIDILSDDDLVYHKINLANAQLANISLPKTSFTDANLTNINFSNASLNNCKFNSATLKNAQFVGADLRSAKFNGANLRNTNFSDTKLMHANLSMANCKNTIFNHANLSNAILYGIDLSSIQIKNTILTGAEFIMPPSCYTNEDLFITDVSQLITDAWKNEQRDELLEAVVSDLVSILREQKLSLASRCISETSSLIKNLLNNAINNEDNNNNYTSNYKNMTLFTPSKRINIMLQELDQYKFEIDKQIATESEIKAKVAPQGNKST